MTNAKIVFISLVMVASSALAKDDKADLELGQKIYANNCVACHGEKGDGQGPAARAIASRKPRNFLQEDFQFGSKREEIFKTISNGVQGSAMPPWKDALSEKERFAVVDYILNLTKKVTRQ
jgi:mono/diheme cytochrome c family protein